MAIISRRQYDHPALATAGGSALHASIENLYTVLGNDSMSRYKAFSAVANSSVGVIAHEFGLDFANLKVQIFTGTYPALTLVSDPIGTGWTVAATSGLASRSIDVTAPASGGPHTFSVLVSHESNATQFIPGLVSIGAQSFAGAKTFLSPILSSLGSAALPGYSFTGDPNTGMWSSAADTLSFSTAGVKVAEASLAGAWTLGSSAGLGTTGSAYHSIYGSIVGAYATGANRFIVANDSGVVISANQYRDGAGTLKGVSTVTGITTLAILRQSSSSGTVFNLQSNYLDAQTANSGSLETNTFSILSGTAAGAWTFGPASGSALTTHTFQSGASAGAHTDVVALTNITDNRAGFFAGQTVKNIGVVYDRSNDRRYVWNNSDLEFVYTSTTTLSSPISNSTGFLVGGKMTSAGAWTLGDVSTSNSRHTINGGISVLTARSSFMDDEPYAISVRNSTTPGTSFFLGAATNGDFQVSASGGGSLGGITQTGAWTFGDGTTNSAHKARGLLRIQSVATANDANLHFDAITTAKSYIGNNGTSSVNITGFTTADGLSIVGFAGIGFSGDNGVTCHGKLVSGAWTLGTTSMTTNHFINSAESTQVLVVESYAATASSTRRILDARYGTDTDCTGGYFFSALNSSSSVIGRIEASSNTTTAFTGSSDSRLKTNPTDFNGLQIVANIIPREYEWISNPGNRQKGFYAQELYEVYPDAVSVGTDDLTEDGSLALPWGIDYSRLTPVLVKAVQELSAKNDALEARLAALES